MFVIEFRLMIGGRLKTSSRRITAQRIRGQVSDYLVARPFAGSYSIHIHMETIDGVLLVADGDVAITGKIFNNKYSNCALQNAEYLSIHGDNRYGNHRKDMPCLHAQDTW